MNVTVKVIPATKQPAAVKLVIAPDAVGELLITEATTGRKVGTLTVELVDPPPPPPKRTMEQMRPIAEVCAACEHLGPGGVTLSERFASGSVDCDLCKSCGGKMSLVSGVCKKGKWNQGSTNG